MITFLYLPSERISNIYLSTLVLVFTSNTYPPGLLLLLRTKYVPIGSLPLSFTCEFSSKIFSKSFIRSSITFCLANSNLIALFLRIPLSVIIFFASS